MKLSEIYSNRDLLDESELLGIFVVDVGVRIADHDFETFRIEPEDFGKILGSPVDGRMTVLEKWDRAKADFDSGVVDPSFMESMAHVEALLQDFDESRIIIIGEGRLLDGWHHLIAASKLGKPVQAIELDDYRKALGLPEPDIF